MTRTFAVKNTRRTKPYMRAMAFVALLAVLPGCGGNHAARPGETHAGLVKENAKAEKLNDLMLQTTMARSATDPNADYVIGAEDLLEIEIFQGEELRRTVRVSSQGYIGMPLIGQVKAKGLTPVRLEKELEAKLGEYMEQPLVSVFVKEYKAQRIGVIGAVASPQVYAVGGQKCLLDMLSLAGGLTKDAGTIAYILRTITAEQSGVSRTETLVIDLVELLERGNIALNIPVFSGDVVNVPKGGVFFVDGAVNKPGAFPFQGGKTSLVKAVAMAEGLKFQADKADLKIFRDNGEGLREVITADYDAINEGREKDVPLKENDIIIVQASGIKSFLSGFLDTVRGVVTFGKAF